MLALLDPVILFFVLGALAGLVKSDLRIPKEFYNTISIYLLLAIGIKGGIELYRADTAHILMPMLATIVLGIVITFLAFLFVRLRFDKVNAIAIATHYGSVSAVTFAVVLSFLQGKGVHYEEYSTVLLVMLEIPAIAVGVLMARLLTQKVESFRLTSLLHEVFLGKTILLLLGGLGIGFAIGFSGNQQINFFFIDLFKGFLALFMLEMGIVTSERFSDLKKVGAFLVLFGISMPFISATLGIFCALLSGMSMGGALVLGTMAASASYIAAPAAMRIALPQANPTYYLTGALGITFPFNIIIGIPLYYHVAQWIYTMK